MKKNCWEFKRCGREPGGTHEKLLGTCPAAIETRLDGVHGGVNGGRTCWVVNATLCEGERQGTLFQKVETCDSCAFHQAVMIEEGRNLEAPIQLLRLLGVFGSSDCGTR